MVMSGRRNITYLLIPGRKKSQIVSNEFFNCFLINHCCC
jgi:hypothetical protein